MAGKRAGTTLFWEIMGSVLIWKESKKRQEIAMRLIGLRILAVDYLLKNLLSNLLDGEKN